MSNVTRMEKCAHPLLDSGLLISQINFVIKKMSTLQCLNLKDKFSHVEGSN